MTEIALLVLAFVCGIAVGVCGMALAIHFKTRQHFDGYEIKLPRGAHMIEMTGGGGGGGIDTPPGGGGSGGARWTSIVVHGAGNTSDENRRAIP